MIDMSSWTELRGMSVCASLNEIKWVSPTKFGPCIISLFQPGIILGFGPEDVDAEVLGKVTLELRLVDTFPAASLAQA